MSRVRWFRLGDGVLGLDCDDRALNQRFDELYGECLVPGAGDLAPLHCRVRSAGANVGVPFEVPELLAVGPFAAAAFAGRLPEHPWFILGISAWLWLTVLFANFYDFSAILKHLGDERADEATASFALVRDFLAELDATPPGALAVALGPLPAEHSALGVVESPRGEDVHHVVTGPDGGLHRYRVRSASYNWAVVPFAVPGNMLPDFPLINKSFELCYACLDR